MYIIGGNCGPGSVYDHRNEEKGPCDGVTIFYSKVYYAIEKFKPIYEGGVYCTYFVTDNRKSFTEIVFLSWFAVLIID